jgi:putative ABC transport system substrate-binding protein
MRRRTFLGILGGAAYWPLAARAQQPALPVVAVLGGATDNADGQARLKAFSHALQELGRNVQLDIRLLGDDLVRIRAHAAELARAKPAVIVAHMNWSNSARVRESPSSA